MVYLVGGLNPFEKYLSKWIISPNRGENKKKWNHHLVYTMLINRVLMHEYSCESAVTSLGNTFGIAFFTRASFSKTYSQPHVANLPCDYVFQVQFNINIPPRNNDEHPTHTPTFHQKSWPIRKTSPPLWRNCVHCILVYHGPPNLHV